MYFILKGANFADSKLGKITVVEGQIGTGGTTIDPNAEYTLTVQPTPSDATVTLTATGYTQSGNSIKVKRGTQVTIKLEKTGYVSQTFTKTVQGDFTATYEIYAESVKTYTLTVNPNPANATVTLNGTETKSITVPEGQSVTWVVSASGYVSQNDVWLATKNETLNITLVSDGSGGTPNVPDTPTGTVTELTFETQGFYNNTTQNGGITAPNSSWVMSDLIPINTITNGPDGYCTSMLQGHSKVAAVYYASSNSTDSSAFLGHYGTTIQGETARYTAEEVKSNAPAGTAYVGFSTHTSQNPFHVYVLQ